MRSTTVFAILVLGGSIPGHGQTPTDSARRHRDSVQVLPAVEIRSLRLAQSIYSAPLAVTRIGREATFGTRGYSLDDAIGRIPGVFSQSRSGGSDIRLVIRGYGARGAGDRSNAGTSRGVRILLDGIPETEPDGRTSFDGIDLAAIHSIEVIRSNATTLWGNAAGGVVSLSSLPDRGAPSEAEVVVGGYGFHRYVVGLNGDLGSGTMGGTVTRTEFAGWRANSAADRWLASAALRTDVGDRTSLGAFFTATDNFFRIPGPLTRAQVEADPSQANATYLQRLERRHNRVGRLGLAVEHDMGGAGTVSSLLFVNPKYLQRSERGTFRDFTRYHVGGNAIYQNRVSLGPRLRLRAMAGLDEAYQDGAILFYTLSPSGDRGTTLRDDKREGANNLGVFSQGELTVGDHWAFTLGGRYDRITYYSDSHLNPAINATKAFARLTPKLGVNYQFTPLHSVYVNIGGGVEAPAGNETDPAGTFGQDTVTAINPLLDPIRSTTYEVGTKQLLVPGSGAVASMSYDVALYRTEVRNEIVPYRGGRFYFTAGKVRRTGLETGVTVETRTGVGASGAVSWSRHRYTDYQVDSVHYGAPGRVADYGGNRVVGVPAWIYNASLWFSPPGARRFRVQGGIQGNGQYFADDANVVPVEGWTIASASIGLIEPVAVGGMTLRGAVSVNNLFDRRYIGSAFLNPDVVDGVPVAFEPGMPRVLTVSVAVGRR